MTNNQEIKTNLLQTTEFPEKMNVMKIEIEYEVLNSILKNSEISYHLKSDKIYFFGNSNTMSELLKEKGYPSEILNPIYINADCIQYHWDIVRVLFYKVTECFLRQKELYFHPRRRNTFYVVNIDNWVDGTPLIGKNQRNGYYVHEGFEYKLHLINKSVFLSLAPLIVLTSDKESEILSNRDYSGFYTKERSRRYNKDMKALLDIWIGFLGDEGKIRVPILNDSDLVFDTKFSKAGGSTVIKEVEKTKKEKRIEQVKLDEYW